MYFVYPKWLEYLGHIISEEGLHLSTSKVKDINEAPQPSSLFKLKSFLVLVKYYAKFCQVQQLYILTPLYKLPNHGSGTMSRNNPLKRIKEMLTAPTLLVHFDESKLLMLVCDASLYGVGIVLSHVMDNHSDT